MDFDDQAQVIIDALWREYTRPELQGRTIYEAARMVGANEVLAKRVVEVWDGPSRIGG